MIESFQFRLLLQQRMMMSMLICLVRRLKRRRRPLKNVQQLSRHQERRNNVATALMAVSTFALPLLKFRSGLKRYLELRGADGGPWRSSCVLRVFWTAELEQGGAT